MRRPILCSVLAMPTEDHHIKHTKYIRAMANCMLQCIGCWVACELSTVINVAKKKQQLLDLKHIRTILQWFICSRKRKCVYISVCLETVISSVADHMVRNPWHFHLLHVIKDWRWGRAWNEENSSSLQLCVAHAFPCANNQWTTHLWKRWLKYYAKLHTVQDTFQPTPGTPSKYTNLLSGLLIFTNTFCRNANFHHILVEWHEVT